MTKRIGGLSLALAIVAASGGADPRGIVLEVDAGRYERRSTPIVVALPALRGEARAFRLERLDDHQPIAVQRLPGNGSGIIWVDRDPVAAGAKRRYRLEPMDSPPREQATAGCTDDGKGLQIGIGGRPILLYNYATIDPPRGIAPIFRRSGFIHPLFSPSGRVLTDDFAPDHAHQHGLFFAWVNTTFEGRHVDFWNQQEQTGRIRHAETLGTTGGPVFAGFTVRLRHDDITSPREAKPVLDEVWEVRAYSSGAYSVIDFESSQACAGSQPLKINAYHYGGLGLRGNRAWFDATAKGNDKPDLSRCGASDFLTSEAKTRADGNHTRPRWLDLSGKIGEPFAGITILGSPGNFRAPQPVRLHPNKPYFCFAPMVLGEFEIAPGRPFVSRYRILLHDGPPAVAEIERMWRDYTEPPRVRVIEEM